MHSSMEAPDASTDERAPGGSQTLMRGLDVLEMVAEGPLPLSELSNRLGLTRSTTHRLAGALVERRMLTFRAREGYSLGPKLLELGHSAGQQVHLARVARAYIEELSLGTGDAVHLGVIEGDQALYLDKVAGSRRVAIGSRIGERQPIASTGLGKALALDMNADQWRDLFPREADGSVNKNRLMIWLERMRAYSTGGYAFDLEENEDQIRCVAAPIRGVKGTIVGAISLSSAAQYMSDERMQSLVPVVQKAAENISRELGWTERSPPPPKSN